MKKGTNIWQKAAPNAANINTYKNSVLTPTRFGAGGPGMCKFVYMSEEDVFRQSFPPITPCATEIVSEHFTVPRNLHICPAGLIVFSRATKYRQEKKNLNMHVNIWIKFLMVISSTMIKG